MHVYSVIKNHEVEAKNRLWNTAFKFRNEPIVRKTDFFQTLKFSRAVYFLDDCKWSSHEERLLKTHRARFHQPHLGHSHLHNRLRSHFPNKFIFRAHVQGRDV